MIILKHEIFCLATLTCFYYIYFSLFLYRYVYASVECFNTAGKHQGKERVYVVSLIIQNLLNFLNFKRVNQSLKNEMEKEKQTRTGSIRQIQCH